MSIRARNRPPGSRGEYHVNFPEPTSNSSPAHIGSLALTVAVAIAVLLSMAISCGGESAGTGYAVTDSAGITIVENGATLLAEVPSWDIDPMPTLTIELGEDAEIVLYEVSGVTSLPGGSLAVTNGGTTQVLLFSSDGRFIRAIGAPGEGPGEFRRIAGVVPMPGDSIGIYDSSVKRLSVFDEEGRLGREVSLNDLIGDFGGTWVQSLGKSGLALLNRGGFQPDPPTGVYRTYTEWNRIDLEGTPLASYGEFPGNELFQDSRSMGSPLFARVTAATTAGNTLVAGTGESPEIRVYGPDGNAVKIIRWFHEPEPATEELFQAFIEKGLATVPEAGRAQVRAMVEGMPKNDFIPPYSTILTSSDGTIWVGSYDGPGVATPVDRPQERKWLIFDSQGILTATAISPEGFRPHVVTGETVVGVYKDELDVESIRTYRFSVDPN